MRFLHLITILLATSHVMLLHAAKAANSDKKTSRLSYFQKLTGDDSDDDKSRWDEKYNRNKDYVYGKEPVQFLADSLQLLPHKGKVLDIAMGEGRNAVFMAKKGYDVEGVDISEVAIRKAKRLAQENNVRIRTVTADVQKFRINEDSYDVIMVFYFLSRDIIPQIKKGLKKGGVVIFENYTVDELKYDKTQTRQYLLERAELKDLFKDLKVLKYREIDSGKEALASIIAVRQ